MENKKVVDQAQVIEKIKQTLNNYIGCRMKFRTNLGRCRVVEREGILEELHPNLFVIRIVEEESQRRTSYTYTDVLTRLVQLLDPQTEDDFFSWLN